MDQHDPNENGSWALHSNGDHCVHHEDRPASRQGDGAGPVDVVGIEDFSDDDETVAGAVDIGDRDYGEEALCRAAEKGGGLTLQGKINLGGHMEVTHNNYQDNRVTDKSTHHHHGDLHQHSHHQHIKEGDVIHHHGDLYKTEHVHYGDGEAGGYTQIKDQSRITMMADEDVFVETWSFKTALERLSYSGILLLTGAAGTGKSSLSRALLRHFDSTGYTPLILHRFEEWRLHVGGDRKQAIVLDHVWGRDEFAPASFRDWAHIFSTMAQLALSAKCVIIVTVNDVVLNTLLAENGPCTIFKHTVDTADDHAALSIDEKMEMLKKHLARSDRGIADDLLREIASSEKSGAHFPTSCRQFLEASDGDRAEWEKIFAHVTEKGAGARSCGAGPKVCVKISPDIIRKSLLKPTKKNPGRIMQVFISISDLGTNFNDAIWTPGSTMAEDNSQETEKHQTAVKQIDTQLSDAQHTDKKEISEQQTDSQDKKEKTREDEEPASKLRNSCRSGDLDSVQELLDFGVDPSSKNKSGSTALHVASLAGHPDVVRTLLDHRQQCPVNETDGKDWTSLHLACMSDRTDVAELLVQHGAELERETSDGITALHVASRYGSLGMARFLLENGASVEAQQTYYGKAYPMHVAAFYGHADVAELLIQFGARAESEDRNGFLPLHYACQQGHVKVVEILLSHSATKVGVAHQANTYLQQLRVDCPTGHIDLVRDLLQCSVGTRDPDGKTTVCRSCYLANKPALENLTLHSTSPDLRAKKDITGLYLAAQGGHLDVMKTLLRAGACTEVKNEDGWTPLHVASYNGNVHVVNLLLEYKTSVDDSHDDFLFTSLHLACREGHEAVVDSLLLHGASPDALDYVSLSPLHHACMKGRPGVVRRLLPKIRDRCFDNNTAGGLLPLACENGNSEVVRCLLDWLPNLAQNVQEGYRALQAACSSGNILVLTILLEHKFPVDAVGKKGNDNECTPLHTAAKKDHDEIVEVLIKYGAMVNRVNYEGCTPLHIACREGSMKVAAILLEKGSADPELRDKTGCTALHNAADMGDYDVVTVLLDKGSADTETRENNGRTALHIAADRGRLNVVKVLLEKGSADTEAKDNEGKTALHAAAQIGSDNIVKTLIGSSADVDAHDLKHQTPLILTASQKVIETLLANNADVNVQSSDGKTALHTSCAARSHEETEINRHEKVKLLLDHGAQVNVADGSGSTPIHLSCSTGDVLILKLLVQHGGTVCVNDSDGNTPLHLACMKGHTPVVIALLEAGADDGEVNHDGNTPLHLACLNLQAGTVKVLLEHSTTANTAIKNKHGQTPFAVVQSMKLEQPTPVVQLQPSFFPSPMRPLGMPGAMQLPGFNRSPFRAQALPGPAAFTRNNVHQQAMNILQEERARNMNEKNAERKRKIDLRNEIMFLLVEYNQRRAPQEAAGTKSNPDSLQGGDLEKKDFEPERENATPDRDTVKKEEETAKSRSESLKEETVGASHASSAAKKKATEREVNQPKATVGISDRTEAQPAEKMATSEASQEASLETDNIMSKTQPRCSAERASNGVTPSRQQTQEMFCDIDEDFRAEGSPVSMHAACYHGNTSSVLSHLPTLTDINVASKSGRTALHYACAGGHGDIAALLLKLNADTAVRDSSGKMPVHYACSNGHLDTVDLLMTQQTTDVNASDGEGRTSLHLAAGRGHGMVCAVLLARGVNVDVRDHLGNTPLILAALGGHSDVCILLLNSGADAEITNNEGLSASKLVNSGKSPSLAKVLARHTITKQRPH